jgi:ATP-dependent DNA helicase RecQ
LTINDAKGSHWRPFSIFVSFLTKFRYLSTPTEILKQYWGYDSFRPLQAEIIDSILAGQDTLALLPTGGGKSVCYQVPAMAMKGMCLVVSPLIALMKDQVERLNDIGIPATCLVSGMHYNDVVRTLQEAANGSYKLLYVSPERLKTELFRDYLVEFDLSLLAVDEAHCISQWGHDFRPAYLEIAAVREAHPRVPVLALTASATARVGDDIAASLKMKQPAMFRSSFARPNIFYRVLRTDDKTNVLLRNIGDECSIVYCRSRILTEKLGQYLSHEGIGATVYHAGLTRERREEAQAAWMDDKSPVMVATTAFGMGIDKAGVRKVIHYDAPEHLEAYYQEAGRAGRDGKPSDALTMYYGGDIARLQASTELQYPPESYLRQVYQAVADYLQVPITASPDRYFPFDLHEFCNRFRLRPAEAMPALKLLERQGLWTLTESVYHPATVQFTADRRTLDSLSLSHPQLAYLTVGLLRMYNGIFHYPVSVREAAVARQLRMNKDEVVTLLGRLHDMELLLYNRPTDGPQLFFHHYRVDSRFLHINMKRINELKQHHQQRVDAMVRFLENETECRERLLLQYFDEQVTTNCGHCDVCAAKITPRQSANKLKTDLQTRLPQTGHVSLFEVCGWYPPTITDTVIQTLRLMADEGTLRIQQGFVEWVG